jgi:hypothetical protein
MAMVAAPAAMAAVRYLATFMCGSRLLDGASITYRHT